MTLVVLFRWQALVIGFLAKWFVWATPSGKAESTFSVITVHYTTITRTHHISNAKARLGYSPNVDTEAWYSELYGHKKSVKPVYTLNHRAKRMLDVSQNH